MNINFGLFLPVTFFFKHCKFPQKTVNLCSDKWVCVVLSIDWTDEDTERPAADDPEQNQEDSRHQTLSRSQKSELI